MAEYLSLGPINAETAMWLRDASLEGKLPTIEQMTADPYEYFPYRFGHALWSYIGERWGDEAVGAILKATLSGGVEPAFRRTIGLSLEQLSDQWRDAVQKRYLPEIGARAKARAVADELLTKKRSEGTLHLAPALSPDGSQVAYFSEKNFYFVDLYLANGQTGEVKRRHPQVRHQQQLRDLPVHQLPGQLVAGRQVSRVRGQARAARRDRHRGRGPEQTGGPDPAQAERRHHAVLEPGRQAARLHRATTAGSATCSRSTATGRISDG